MDHETLPELDFSDLPDLSFDDKTNNDKNKENATIAAGVVAGGGAIAFGLKKAKDAIFRPATEIKIREKTIDQIKRDYLNNPFVSSKDVPSQIISSGKEELQKMATKQQKQKFIVSERTKRLQDSRATFSRSLNDFDKKILDSSVEQMSSTLTKAFPEYLQETYRNYGAVLNDAEDVLIKNGKQLDSTKYIKDVLSKTIDDSIKAGVPKDKLGRLYNFISDATGDETTKVIDENAKPFRLKKPISVRQLKGNVVHLSKDVPKETALALKGNWGSFMETNAPEVSVTLKDANKNYSRFAKLRESLYDAVDPDTGEFSRVRLNQTLYRHAKSNIKTGLEESIKLMVEGEGILPKKPELKSTFSQLESAKETRNIMFEKKAASEAVAQTKIARGRTLSQEMYNKINNKKQEIIKWSNKASELLSEQKGIGERHPIRSGLAGVEARKTAVGAGIANIARRSVGLFGIYPMISQAVFGFFDPLQAVAGQLGFNIPDKNTKERIVLEDYLRKNMLTGKEADFAIRLFGASKTPEEAGISPDEQKEILDQYKDEIFSLHGGT
jgi:hypothetical protein